VGGDFYTELPCPQRDGRAVAYGDVSGKSISGALMMMAAHEVLNALALAHPDPVELLRLANERLYRLRGRGSGMSGGSFVALGWIGLAPDSGQVRYALAGQPPPLVVRTDGRIDTLAMPPHRLPLGALRTGGHQVLEAELAPGEVLVAYSDGLVDAQSPDGELFGDERLHRALRSAPRDAAEMVQYLVEEVEGFTRGHTPYDDVTLVVARRGERAA
jgi:serine phosphatase RsbU (regulator of sigma subunit)